jgi:N-methylhydantoinase B/oxoprolinase/acetone carboxylase alpha subunit
MVEQHARQKRWSLKRSKTRAKVALKVNVDREVERQCKKAVKKAKMEAMKEAKKEAKREAKKESKKIKYNVNRNATRAAKRKAKRKAKKAAEVESSSSYFTTVNVLRTPEKRKRLIDADILSTEASSSYNSNTVRWFTSSLFILTTLHTLTLHRSL